MHQSCMSSTQPKYLAFISGGESRTRPSRTAAPAPLATGRARLDRGAAAAAVAHRVDVRADLGDDPALLAQGPHHGGAGLETVEPLERAVRGDHAVLVHDGRAGQVVPAADL